MYILDDTCLLKFDDEVVCLVINSVDVCVCVCVLSLLLRTLVGDLLRVGWLLMARTAVRFDLEKVHQETNKDRKLHKYV